MTFAPERLNQGWNTHAVNVEGGNQFAVHLQKAVERSSKLAANEPANTLIVAQSARAEGELGDCYARATCLSTSADGQQGPTQSSTPTHQTGRPEAAFQRWKKCGGWRSNPRVQTP